MSVTITYNFDDANDAQTIDLGPMAGGVDITSLDNGGFAGIGDSAGSIFGSIFGTSGAVLDTWSPNLGANGVIDQLSNGDLVMASQDGDSILLKIVNSGTGADVVATFDLADNGFINSSNADVIALAGGGFCLVSQQQFVGADHDINVQFFTNNAGFGPNTAVDVSLEDDRDASVTQLDGGNVVVTWTRTIGAQTEVWFKIIDTSAGDVSAATLVDTTGTINRHARVTALDGGGFGIVYEDNEFSGANINITLAKFDASGVAAGKHNLSQPGNDDIEPSVIRLPNGLLAVTSSLTGGLPFIKLVDPVTGSVLAARDVIGATFPNDPHEAVAAAFGIGRVAVFYNDATAGPGGSAFNVVRVSSVDPFTFNAETIQGDDFIDIITGGDLGDMLSGGGNDDRISGGEGADTINGGAGKDFINGGTGVDTIDGGDGDDLIEGDQGYDFIFGGQGNDVIYAMTAADIDGSTFGGEMYGDDGNDRIFGSAINEILSGEADNDVLEGMSGDDDLRGGAGSDTASYANAGGSVTVTLTNAVLGVTGGSSTGAAGNDTMSDIENITGSAFADTLTGNNLANTLVGGGGIDNMTGGAGDDRYFADNASDAVTELAGAGSGFDSIFATVSYTIAANVERLFLQGGAISATGRDGQNDYLYGNALNNILDGKTGTDNLNGGLGNDSYYVNTSVDTVNETAGGGTLDTIFARTSYTIAANVERLFLLDGGNYNANGRNGQNDFLAGNSGNNIINGFSGNDTIRGGLGNDTLTGGAGLDTFQFLTAPNTALNRDVITDFNVADDTFQMENAVYTLLGANGVLAAALFKNLSLVAQDADDRILYDQANGNLFYDTNGLTAGGRVHFAEVTNGLALTAADFVVV